MTMIAILFLMFIVLVFALEMTDKKKRRFK